MDLLELANELNLKPKRAASTNGGEYHCPCPNCGGKDRFIIWNEAGRYYCRRCESSGDSIQFCRDFLRLNFIEACSKAGITTPKILRRKESFPKNEFIPQKADAPSDGWQKAASEFIDFTHKVLIKNKKALEFLYKRCFTTETIQKFKLGWNPITQFVPRSHWGLGEIAKHDGRDSKLWLPSGIVIPTYTSTSLCKIKIRRSAGQEQDQYPKYVEVSGSMKCPSYYAEGQERVDLPIVIVESELDAMLIQQEAGDLCACLAIGGATKKPDQYADQLLQSAPQILFSLDFDEAGVNAYSFWKNRYKKVKPWPAPNEKSPGDALKAGIDLRKWVSVGISCV